jgi:hypothetical protein
MLKGVKTKAMLIVLHLRPQEQNQQPTTSVTFWVKGS